MPSGFRGHRSSKLRVPVRRKTIVRKCRDSTPQNISNETANASDNTEDFRTTFYHSLSMKQKNEYFTQKCSFLDQLRKNNFLCDVTLVCENDVEVNAHKVILSGVSQYFFTKFTKYNEDRLLLKDFDSSTIESLVHHAYTDEITINEDNIEAILSAADYFCMEILRDVCCNFLANTITLSNCLRIRAIADLYTCESLLNTCNDFIKKHFREVVKDEKFLDLSLDNLLKLIQSDDLNVPSENTVYTAVMKWLKHDLDKRQKHLYELMRYVRLPFLGTDRLSRLLRLEPLFENIPDMQQLFLKALIEENSVSGISLGILGEHVPIPRVSYSSVPNMFVIGGCDDDSSQKIVDCYDIRSRMWRPVEQLAEGISGNSAVSTQNEIYVSGQRKMKIFDMITEKWIKNVNMPLYRKYHASVLLNSKIYVIGGTDEGELTAFNSVKYYDLKEEKWYDAPNMEESRAHVTAAVLNGKIYVVGGSQHVGDSAQPSDTVEYYDPATSTWNCCKNMNYGRYGAACCVVDNLLYVVGGQDGGGFGDRFEVYDPVADKWDLMPNLPAPRMHHGVCHENGYLFAAGGEMNNSCISSIDVFCFDTREWFTMRTGLKVPRNYAAVVMAYGNLN